MTLTLTELGDFYLADCPRSTNSTPNLGILSFPLAILGRYFLQFSFLSLSLSLSLSRIRPELTPGLSLSIAFAGLSG
jgi:hypothetical protein